MSRDIVTALVAIEALWLFAHRAQFHISHERYLFASLGVFVLIEAWAWWPKRPRRWLRGKA